MSGIEPEGDPTMIVKDTAQYAIVLNGYMSFEDWHAPNSNDIKIFGTPFFS